MTSKLPTGIEVLDRKLDGGIPPGHIVGLSAAPASQSELFLYEIASVRETVYLTTERTASDVEGVLERTGTDTTNIEIHHIEDTDPLDQAEQAIETLPEAANLIADPMMLLERQDTSRYRAFLNTLRARIDTTNSIAVLHCLSGQISPSQRVLTKYMTDIVFDLTTEDTGDGIENRLTVPKFRGGQALEETIKLNLTADVTIDVSRKIV